MARVVDVRTVEGDAAGSVELDDAIFGIEPNPAVLHQVVTAQLAAARAGTHSTKTRAEVSGGGKKPFKQKGTGRARQGSTRAPHWAGGGVALGPKPRSYRQKTPRKMIQLALRSALSDRAAEARVAIVDEWPWTSAKTKDAKAALAALGLEGKILIVLDRETDEATFLSFRNLREVQSILTGELNAYDVLCNDWVVFSRQTLPGVATEVDARPAAEPETPEPETAGLETAKPETAKPEPATPAASDDVPEVADATDAEDAEDAEEEKS